MKKKLFIFTALFAVTALISAESQAQLAVGDTVGIDFDSAGAVFPIPAEPVTAPSAASGFNRFNTQTADGASASFSGTLNDITGSPVTGLGFSVQNNSGKASGLTGIVGVGGTGIFNDASIFSDSYGGANVGNLSREDGGLLLELSLIHI